MKLFLLGLIIGLVVVPLVGYEYVVTGHMPVATAAKALPFERTLAHKALNIRVGQEMPKTVPLQADEAAYTAGVPIYRDNCAVCHGLPGQDQTAIAKGMYPKPPQLFKGKGVTDDEPGETYWKVANGIRLTGMPAFDRSLSQTQMWQVSLLLANADKLPVSVKQALVPAAASVPPVEVRPAAPSPATPSSRRNRK